MKIGILCDNETKGSNRTKRFFQDASIKPCNNIKKETNKDNVIDVNNASCK